MDKSTIVGIAVGVSLGSLILFGLLFFCCWKVPKKNVKVGYKSVGGKEKGEMDFLDGRKGC